MKIYNTITINKNNMIFPYSTNNIFQDMCLNYGINNFNIIIK